jgi:hypothetical protein
MSLAPPEKKSTEGWEHREIDWVHVDVLTKLLQLAGKDQYVALSIAASGELRRGTFLFSPEAIRNLNDGEGR